jgi:nucleoside-diphosphate kinase
MDRVEETLVLLKPDALERGLVGEIVARFERAGLRVHNAAFIRFSIRLLETHYEELRGKNPRAYQRNLRYLDGKPGIALVLGGVNAIAKVRLLIGPTEPASAPPGTIRGDLSSDTIAIADAADRGLFNLVHAADSAESARKEIGLWFPVARYVPSPTGSTQGESPSA